VVESTFASSGAQTRAVLGGYAADVVVLSLADEVDFLAAGGLINHDWREGPYGGFITRSLAAIAVRKGNPRHIHTWKDLAGPDVEVLMPSPKTSGGAMWCIAAIYAAGLFPDSSTVAGPADSVAAARLLAGIQHRVLVMDASAHRAMESFESGLGDALITYESEILWQSRIGEPVELVVPDRSLRIENPAAVVDRYAEAHGATELAAEFVSFLVSPEVQRALARFGLRPVDPAILQEYRTQLPVPARVFGIEELGGWKHVQERLFGSAGVWTRILQQQQEEP
jgi:sulfate/thiosulfate-binding protein